MHSLLLLPKETTTTTITPPAQLRKLPFQLRPLGTCAIEVINIGRDNR